MTILRKLQQDLQLLVPKVGLLYRSFERMLGAADEGNKGLLLNYTEVAEKNILEMERLTKLLYVYEERER